MILAVDWAVKPQHKQTQKKTHKKADIVALTVGATIVLFKEFGSVDHMKS